MPPDDLVKIQRKSEQEKLSPAIDLVSLLGGGESVFLWESARLLLVLSYSCPSRRREEEKQFFLQSLSLFVSFLKEEKSSRGCLDSVQCRFTKQKERNNQEVCAGTIFQRWLYIHRADKQVPFFEEKRNLKSPYLSGKKRKKEKLRTG